MPDSIYAAVASLLRYVFLALLLYFLLRLVLLSLSEYRKIRRVRNALASESLHKLQFLYPDELEGEEFLLREETRIGRRKDCEVRLRYAGIRREEAVIVKREQGFTLYPFSRKRVSVNGEVVRREVELFEGDILEFSGMIGCKYILRSRAEAAEGEADG